MTKKTIAQNSELSTNTNQDSPSNVVEELVENDKIPHPIEEALLALLRGMDDFDEAVSIVMPAVSKMHIDTVKKLEKKLDKFIEEKDSDGNAKAVAHGPHAASILMSTVREYERVKNTKLVSVLERSLFIGLFSEYDVFIGQLFKAIYSRKPDLYKNIRREITLSELLEFESLDAVKLDMLDKETDSFRRDSYVDQFNALEKKFEIKLRDFPEWASFVELSQRRNLMTHNGGVVSEQYLTVCEREGYRFNPRPAIGEKLNLGPEYFYSAIKIISKVAYMLTHTLWRKILPSEFAKANESMNDTIFDLLHRKRWSTAAEFGMFGLRDVMCKEVSDITRRIRVINTAIALRQQNRKNEVEALLDSVDWTASVRDFKLACKVLKGEYKEAANLMKDIGKRGEMVTQMSYYDWPLFADFRDTVEFQSAYEAIYEVPFIEKATETAQAKTEKIDENNDKTQTKAVKRISRKSSSAKTLAEQTKHKKTLQNDGL